MEKQLARIMMIDDDETSFFLTKTMLEHVEGYGFEVDLVSDPEEAVKVMAADSYDVYLLDYRLGTRTGLDVLTEAVNKGCRSPVIVLTAYSDKKVDLALIKAGAADFLVKDQVNADLLERAIRYAIERKKIEEKLRHDAFYDSLTGLPNRALFLDRLGQSIKRKKRVLEYSFAVLFLDLDRFKVINDSLGHIAGDEYLCAVARQLEKCLRNIDTVSRLGGDEFAILLNDIHDVSHVIMIANRIQKMLETSRQIHGKDVTTTVSIGIALSSPRYIRSEDMMRDADNAMYRAKTTGKARHEIFDVKMHTDALNLLDLESDLRQAIEKEHFVVYYQPIVSVKTGRIVSLEALIRWMHPKRGLIPPLDFIPIAEETGLIIPIGEWILTRVCMQSKIWQTEIDSGLQVAVNYSARQFQQHDLSESINDVLNKVGIKTQKIAMEITETTAMTNIEKSLKILNALDSMGIRISLDDFGTGYSSLSSLRQLPIKTIKIDRAFIKDIPQDVNQSVLTRAIIAMAHSMKIDVVAEGVETREQLEFLKNEKCDYYQGFFFCRPLPEREITEFILSHLRNKRPS